MLKYIILTGNPTHKILESIRNEFEGFLNRKFNDKELSLMLGFNDRFITNKYYRIRKGELGNLRFNQFQKIKKIISSDLGKVISMNLLKEIKIYENYLKNYKDYKMSNLKSKKHHPFFNSKYFNIINTKEKAYWLGFIYADGTIIESKNKERNNKSTSRIKLSQNQKDRILIYRFCRIVGLNIKKISIYKKWNAYEIRVRNHQMVDDLMKHGVLHRKSKIIKLPSLNNRKLYLAFLLGFFDGDGEMGSTRIHSGSKTFLIQIKKKFNIPNKIQEDIRKNDKLVESCCYALTLGSELFNEMLQNYKNSLKRKRIKKITDLKKYHEMKYKLKVEKLPFSKTELKKLLQRYPKTRLSKLLNISYYDLNKLIQHWDL